MCEKYTYAFFASRKTSVLKALIVDSSRLILDRLESMLAETGKFSMIASANDLSEALRQYEDVVPDLILLDVNLPGSESFRFLETLKQKTCVVIAFSIEPCDWTEEEYHALGIDYFFDKYSVHEEISYSILRKIENKITGEMSELKDYSNVIDRLSDPVYICDASGLLQMYNKAAANLWGRNPSIGKEKWCGSVQFFDKDGCELPFDKHPLSVSIRERRAIDFAELMLLRPNGERRKVIQSSVPIYHQDGTVRAAISMLKDITDEPPGKN